MATKVNITRMRGDTYPILLTVKKNKIAIPITGFTFKLTVSSREEPSDDTYLFQLIGTIVDALKGQAKFEPSVEDMNVLGKKYYDIQVIDASGYIYTPIKGMIEFEQDKTK